MRWKEFFVVLAVVALVSTFLARTGEKPEAAPSATASVAPTPPQRSSVWADIKVEVEGEPESLEDLRLSCKLTSPSAVRLPLRGGVPLGSVNIGNGKTSLDFLHHAMLVDGKIPDLESRAGLQDETRTLNEYRWEILGRDLVADHSRDIVELVGNKLSITVFANYEAPIGDSGDYEWKQASGFVELSR